MHEMSSFAKHIMETKYSHTKPDGTLETWDEIARRVAESVMGAVNAPKELIAAIQKVIAEKKFIPGGRYLYASGRTYHQTNNCYEGRTEVVTRWGTKTFEELVGSKAVLMTSNGKWIEAEVRSFGKQELMEVVLIRAGVKKTLYATPGHSWRIQKNQTRDGRPAQKRKVRTSDLKEGDRPWMVFGYGINRTPISPDGVRHGIVWGDGCVCSDAWGFNTAKVRLCGHKKDDLLRFFSEYRTRTIDNDIEVNGLPRVYKEQVRLGNDRSYLLGWLSGYFAADGCVDKYGKVVISSTDEESLKLVKDVCYVLGIGAYGIVHTDRVSNLTDSPSRLFSVTLMREHLTPEFFLGSEHRKRFEENPAKRQSPAWRVESVRTTDRIEEVFCAVVPDTNEFVLADNILTGNCLLLAVEDSREGWAELLRKASMALMTGAGIGVNYSRVRAEGEPIMKTGGTATGPLALMQMVNEVSRGVMQGGSRRSAVLAILSWKHPDIYKYIAMKNWPDHVRELKGKDVNFPATMDGTNTSVQLDDEFFEAFHNTSHTLHSHASSVYWAVIEQMLKTGEPGFTVDVGENHWETLRNACGEVSSADSDDICNLGSVNMARTGSLEDMKTVVELGTAFLLAGTVYSDVPYEEIRNTRDKNRRLGLGLMGLHEWLLKRGKTYGPDEELEKYLEVYAGNKEISWKYADMWGLSRPVKTRAIAPTGTTGIVAETTTGVEPIFCSAYKRRYRKGSTLVEYQYVIDPTAKRLVEESGVNPDAIEDAYTLAENVEKRIAFQAWVQKYVDHGVSSSVNLPAWGTEFNNHSRVLDFGNMLIKYLPQLRGITAYPDGARAGQPLTPVKYHTAAKHVGQVFVETVDVCDLKGGSCGA